MNFLANKTFKKFRSSLLQAVGGLAILLGILDVLFPNILALEFSGIFWVSLVSLIWTIIQIIPKRKISRYLAESDTEIVIKVGDLFNEDSNLVIGMTDVFDTEKGDIIKSKSVQGQFLANIYGDNRARLDTALSEALISVPSSRDSQKHKGKNMRYPIGTVATLSVATKKYFCSAYSYMGNDLKAKSDISMLTSSLEMLWEEIRLKGQRGKIAMPVLGSDLARINAVSSHSTYIKLIVSSFILFSKQEKISEQLTIVIHKDNLEKVNMLDLEDFLQNF